ncbi:M24 family metallopeptidase [Floccifex sp.]|uniref:M24 family metallopeptidase n=1 Tax=Floccifex sp. TaxID=2815810 RepID=UPI003F064F89
MKIRSLKEQYKIQEQCLKERLNDILPEVMFQSEADMWIVASKEYNEEPIFRALTPPAYLTARRITMLVFVKEENYIHRYSLSMPDEDLDRYYEPFYQFGKESQMDALTRLFNKYNPKQIAINCSTEFAFSDGLSMGIYTLFLQNLEDKWLDRMINDDLLAIKLMEIRTQTEMQMMPEVMEVAHSIMEEMYTTAVIKPGITTTDDLVWFMKEKVNSYGLSYWFEPTMDLQRENGTNSRMDHCVIEKGDLLHCDFGITYMNMCTDTQRLAYVAKDNETSVPEKLIEGMKKGNRFQDIVMENMIAGKTGNDVFLASKQQALEEGLHATLYSHPCNVFGHGPGPTIGLYSQQEAIPVKGDIELSNNTCYALELNVEVDGIYYYLEETIALQENGPVFLYKNRDQITFIK